MQTNESVAMGISKDSRRYEMKLIPLFNLNLFIALT